ncbi:response regulator [Aurantibacillus circumpalustris]|uniref:response regulator n=1 Tax=Aurantibacillus circumpalustris TaxID=3036359 RepID=UPI00295C3039|nr:response regulator [Aurantibacillus circumpalustris]
MVQKILIIDDNVAVRENTSELLELAGYETITSSDGKQGLQMMRTNKPDLILCDISMPVLDGFGVLQALQNIPGAATIPFIFLTSKAEMSDMRKAMDLGADDYLTKPYTGDSLLKIVSARIKKSTLLKKAMEESHEFKEPSVLPNEQDNYLTLLENKPIKKIRKKGFVYSEGDSANSLYFLKCGKLKIYKSNESGKDYIIDLLMEGDFFGYTALLEDSVHKESVMAIETSEVVMVPKQDFLHYLNGDNNLSIKFIKLLSKNLIVAEDKLIKLAYNSARKRVAEALLFVAGKFMTDDKHEITFELNRENLSSLAGISPESVSRHLTDFKDEGLLESNGGTIKICDIKKLEKIKN